MLEAASPRGLTARVAALPQRRQELIGDAGLAVALAAVNLVALLPYRHQLHPLWLALVLVAGAGHSAGVAPRASGQRRVRHRRGPGRV